ncbi:EAL domain-containing protein [Vibrio vulnificus]
MSLNITELYRRKSAFSLVVLTFILLMLIKYVAYQAARASIIFTLSNFADSYIKQVEDIIALARKENMAALELFDQCDVLAKNLRYTAMIRELYLVDNNFAVCSSERGAVNFDITRFLSAGVVPTSVLLFDLLSSPGERALLVANGDLNHPTLGAISVIEPSLFNKQQALLMDDRVERTMLEVDGQFYPKEGAYLSSGIYAFKQSKLYPVRVQLHASQSFILKRVAFFTLLSILFIILSFYGCVMLSKWFRYKKSILPSLKKALNSDDELFLMYQPIVNQSGENVGVEALLRWRSDRWGMVPPNRFIPIAEQFGVIDQVTDYLIKTVTNDWHNLSSPRGFYVSINLPISYLNHEEHIRKLLALQTAFQKQGQQLALEITERELVNDAAMGKLTRLREAGILIGIADFGTGQTALYVLQTLRFDFLKIDKCFIDSIETEHQASAVLNSIIELAQKLNVGIVSEGVENRTQQEFLLHRNVSCMQGYYFSKPRMLDEIKTQLSEASSSHPF